MLSAPFRTLTDRVVLVELGRVELQEGEGDMKTADGGGVLALTGVLDRLSRHLSAVFDLYSPFKLLKRYEGILSFVKCHFKVEVFFTTSAC